MLLLRTTLVSALGAINGGVLAAAADWNPIVTGLWLATVVTLVACWVRLQGLRRARERKQ